MNEKQDQTPAIDADKFKDGIVSVLSIPTRPKDDDETVIILHKDHPAIVTDETTVKWQALSLAYLMASAGPVESERNQIWEQFTGYMPRLEFSYIEHIANEHYEDILQGRENHPDPLESELLEKTGLRLLNKWLARKHGGELTDSQADQLTAAIIANDGPLTTATP
ncbi:MAG: hypothetical protein ACTICQ_10385 [Glutamicibacter arilaitensis]|uniref:hypothetical protein n=1 Tax=Glutamicibacter arilaitensis TaxID=256701 RepID=UPI003FB79D28